MSFLCSSRPSLGVLIAVVAVLVGAGTGCRMDADPSGGRPTAPATAAAEQEGHGGEHGAEEAELALHMSRLQRWIHKTALSVEARNRRLADFYLHETEETVETIRTEAPTYEGYEIGRLSEEYLAPTLDSLGTAVDAADWPGADRRLRRVAASCNQCHHATDHGFVHVQLDSLANPYAQSFAPQGAAR